MTELARGANTAITHGSLTVAVHGAQQGTVDLMIFQVTDDRRVRSDDDFIFFNNPASPEGAVKLIAPDQISVDLRSVPTEIHSLAVAVALDDSVAGSLATITDLGVQLSQDAGNDVRCPASGLSTERAAVLVELYRRNGDWKARNVSAGWDGGLTSLVAEHGVDISDGSDAAGPGVPPAEPVSVPAAVDPLGVRTVPGEGKLSLEKRQKLDLRKKEVAKVLLTKGASGVRARVVLVLDKTGSMHRQYKKKVVNRVVERMVPVATQIDDDGKLEPYLYAKKFLRLPEIEVHTAEAWSDTYLHLSGTHGGFDYSAIGAVNDEIPIMSEIIATLTQGASTPTLVLFFTDGGFTTKTPIVKLMRQASELPAFWQFVGIGKANYGLLEQLDTLSGRKVDNAGFFALDDIDKVDDAVLYKRLLSEFPEWLRAARSAGIVG